MKPFLILCILCLSPKLFAALPSREELLQLFSLFQKTYDSDLQTINTKLVFNYTTKAMAEDYWWNLNDKRAAFHLDDSNSKNIAYIYVFGGIAKTPRGNLASVSVTICHELGHLFSEGPFKDNGSPSEGAADYYSFDKCMKRILPMLPEYEVKPNNSFKDFCNKHLDNQTNSSFELCIAQMDALDRNLETLENSKTGKLHPFMSSSYVAKKHNSSSYYYPDIECRVQTMRNAIVGLPRPRCWFVP
jgi:hypothetical protein